MSRKTKTETKQEPVNRGGYSPETHGAHTGGYRQLQIGLMFGLNPAEATKHLRRLLAKHAGSTTAAAAATGINVATIKRWCAKAKLADPRFEADLAAMRQGAGDRVA